MQGRRKAAFPNSPKERSCRPDIEGKAIGFRRTQRTLGVIVALVFEAARGDGRFERRRIFVTRSLPGQAALQRRIATEIATRKFPLRDLTARTEPGGFVSTRHVDCDQASRTTSEQTWELGFPNHILLALSAFWLTTADSVRYKMFLSNAETKVQVNFSIDRGPQAATKTLNRRRR